MSKIIKHEFKDTWLEITIICGAFVVMAALTGLILRISNYYYYFSTLLVIAMVLLYVIASVIVLINIIKSFNNKIFGNEGYLTLTLPITVDQLILGKLIVNFIWMVIVAVTLVLGLGLMFIILDNHGIDIISSIFRFAFDNFGNFLLSMVAILLQALFALVLLVFVLSVLNIGKIKKFKFLFGLILYYLISTIVNWFGNLLLIIPYRVYIDDNKISFERFSITNRSIFNEPFMGFVNLNMAFWCLVGIVGLYFLTKHFIKNLLELE